MPNVIEKMLASDKAEALAWLKGASETSFRNLGELETTEESIALVQDLYDRGAIEVLACKIDIYPDGQNSGYLLIRLPSDAIIRAQLFEADRMLAGRLALDGTKDVGQEWLFEMLD